MSAPAPFDHPPRPMAQRVGAILWPSFFAAGVATMVFFAFVDPLALRDMTFPDIEISRGPEPDSHKNPNWITGHRDYFDRSCQKCHTVTDPGGTSDTSFCSHSAGHGPVWEFAGFDAPGLFVEFVGIAA